MPFGNFLQCSKYRMRAVNYSNSILKRLDHQNATIIAGYLLLNFIRESTPEDAGKRP